MASRFYVPPTDPGYGRIGEALGRGLERGVAGFMAARQARRDEEARRAAEEERRRRLELDEARFNASLTARHGGRGPLPSRVVSDPVAQAMSPWQQTGATGPDGQPIRLATSIQQPQAIQRTVPDTERYQEILPHRPSRPGAYLPTPAHAAQLDLEAQDAARQQRIRDALVAAAPQVGVDPNPFIGPDGSVDVAGLRTALAAAYGQREQARRVGGASQWEVRRAEDQLLWPIVESVFQDVSRADPRPPAPEDRPFFANQIRAALAAQGLPGNLTGRGVELLYSTYGSVGRGREGPGVERALSELIGAFADSPQGILFGIGGDGSDSLEQWLEGSGSLALQQIAARYGYDPAELASLLRARLGWGAPSMNPMFR